MKVISEFEEGTVGYQIDKEVQRWKNENDKRWKDVKKNLAYLERFKWDRIVEEIEKIEKKE